MQETVEEPSSEIKEVTQQESSDWGFKAVIQVLVKNPDGSNVALENSYTANPHDEQFVKDPDHIHKTTRFFWDARVRRRGEEPFRKTNESWYPQTTLTNERALLERCKEDARSVDADAILEDLQERKEMYDIKLSENITRETLATLGNELGESGAELFTTVLEEFRHCHNIEIKKETSHPHIADVVEEESTAGSLELAKEYVWKFAALYEITDQKSAINLEERKENERIWYLDEKPEP
jgi:hypothetical protein